MREELSEAVSLEIVDDVAIVRLDDGKANAMGQSGIAGVTAGLERAAAAAHSVALVGREGRFSAGFDLAVMAGDDREAQGELLAAGARLCHRIYMHPQPVVAACTGHALALGALMLAACDMRFCADGEFKIGTNEVAIGMALPRFGVELARDRLSKRHFQVAVQHARVYDPAGALSAGWVDELVAPDQVEAAAIDYARTVGPTLHPAAFARTRLNTRGHVGDAILAGLALDLTELG